MERAPGMYTRFRNIGLLRERQALNLDEKNTQVAFRQPHLLVHGAA